MKIYWLRSWAFGVFFCFLLANFLNAQVGGRTGFDFLQLSPAARATALGGSVLSLLETEPALFLLNPAAANDSMHSNLSFSYVNYIADISYVNLCYSHTLEHLGTFSGGIQHFGMGSFTETDEFGNIYGNFQVNHTNLTGGAKRSFGDLHLGANFKVMQSTIYYNTAWAIAFDFGALYNVPKWQTQFAATISNLGLPVIIFEGGSPNPLPFNLQVGASHRLGRSPLRFSLVASHLNRYPLVSEDPTQPRKLDLSGNPISDKPSTTDRIFRHINLGAEFIFSPNFQLRLGYNHRRKRELSLENEGLNFNGISLGVMINIKKIMLEYTYAGYHSAAGLHQFQATIPLNRYFKRLSRAKASTTPLELTPPPIINPDTIIEP